MTTPFCPGYAQAPFQGLVESYPDETVYPSTDFRVEWGPMFHRGRLDGSARVLVIGQDPAQHEAIARRILMGTAGRRVQGFLAKLGITSSYVMVNSFLYSVYGQQGGAHHINDAAITVYRNAWLKSILDNSNIQAVVAFGSLADKAWTKWLASPAAAGRAPIAFRKLLHPTSPEAGSGDIAAATKTMLAAYNGAIVSLSPLVMPKESATIPAPYGDAFTADDLPAIPQRDLPAGLPPWMGTHGQWAVRDGQTAAERRRSIRVTAPI